MGYDIENSEVNGKLVNQTVLPDQIAWINKQSFCFSPSQTKRLRHYLVS